MVDPHVSRTRLESPIPRSNSAGRKSGDVTMLHATNTRSSGLRCDRTTYRKIPKNLHSRAATPLPLTNPPKVDGRSGESVPNFATSQGGRVTNRDLPDLLRRRKRTWARHRDMAIFPAFPSLACHCHQSPRGDMQFATFSVFTRLHLHPSYSKIRDQLWRHDIPTP